MVANSEFTQSNDTVLIDSLHRDDHQACESPLSEKHFFIRIIMAVSLDDSLLPLSVTCEEAAL
jgi:hypothetical protein